LTTTAICKAIIQPVSMEWKDADVIRLLKERNEEVFGQVFKENFKDLRKYAFSFVQEQELAEDIVQNVFYKLWERMEVLNFSDSLAAYLYRAVYNESLNALKHNKVKRVYQTYIHRHMKDQTDPAAHKKVQLGELEQRLRAAINELPEQCRAIFQMSRFEDLRYRDIGDRLGISVKTVENQMGKALRILRGKLIDFLPLLLFYLLNR